MARPRCEPIITSLLDVDFYKFTMIMVMLHRYKDAEVTFAFHMRTKGVDLTQTVRRRDLLREIRHVRQLRFTPHEIAFLRSTGVITEPALAFLQDVQLPPVQVRKDGASWSIRSTGPWPVVTLWETIILAIVNELHYRGVMAHEAKARGVPYDMVLAERLAEGRRRLAEKIALLRAHPNVESSEQGTRRRLFASWQDEVVAGYKASGLVEAGQFAGTSNVLLAMKHGLRPIGTMAHEMCMVYAALAGDTDEALRESVHAMMADWVAVHGDAVSTVLTDTFGTDSFFRDLRKDEAYQWRTYRQDSGDAFAYRDKLVAAMSRFGINPITKTISHSDGLDIDLAIRLEEYDRDHVGCNFGIGTFNTNDVGYPPLSIVMKAVRVRMPIVPRAEHRRRRAADPSLKPQSNRWRWTVKLSDNPAKATGPADEVARYKRAFGYVEQAYVECVR